MIRPLLPVKSRDEQAFDAAQQARGVTLAAIFDWTLAAFLVALLVATILLRGPGSRQATAAAALALIGVPLLLLVAEGLRRAREVARVLQIGLSGLIVFANAAGLLRDLRDLLQGDFNPSPNLPSLLIGIYVLWGLTRRQTALWFADTTPAEALRHYNGRWLASVIIIGATAGAIAALLSLT